MTCFEDESTSATHYVVISCGQSRAQLHYPLFSPLWYNVRSSFRVVLITACSNVTNTVYSLHEITWIVTHTVGYIHREDEKGNHISFMNKSFNMQCKLTKFSTVTVSEYYDQFYLFNFLNLHNVSAPFICKECDIGYSCCNNISASK